MKDIENLVITNIAKVIADDFPTAEVSGEYIEEPASFPHVFVLQINKSDAADYMSTGGIDNAQNVTIQIIVYSNKLGTAKSECKNIMEKVDEAMRDMRFRLTYQAHVPNFDSRIYRLVRRYSGAVRVSYCGDEEILMITPR